MAHVIERLEPKLSISGRTRLLVEEARTESVKGARGESEEASGRESVREEEEDDDGGIK